MAQSRKNTKKKSSGTKTQSKAKKTTEKSVKSTKKADLKSSNNTKNKAAEPLNTEMISIAVMGLSLVVLICVVASDRMGFVGKYISVFMKHLVGIGALAVPVVFGFMGFRIFRHKCDNLKRSSVIFTGFLLAFISIAHVLTYKNASVMNFAGYVSECYLNGSLSNGGLIGALIGGGLSKIIGTVGAYILLVVALVILFIMATGKSISAFFEFISDAIDGIKDNSEEYYEEYEEEPAKQEQKKPEQVTLEQYEKDREKLNEEKAKQIKSKPAPIKKKKGLFSFLKSDEDEKSAQQKPPFAPGFPVDIRMGEEKENTDEEITIENYIVNENNKFIRRTLKVPDFVPHLSDKVEDAKKAMHGEAADIAPEQSSDEYEPEILFAEVGGNDEQTREITINGEKHSFEEVRNDDKNEIKQNEPILENELENEIQNEEIDTPPWEENRVQHIDDVDENDEEARAVLEALKKLEMGELLPQARAEKDEIKAEKQPAEIQTPVQDKPIMKKPTENIKAEQGYNEGEEPLIIEAEEEKLVNSLATDSVKTEYKFPKLDFLAKGEGSNGIDRKEMYEKAKKLENTLSIFGIDAKVNNISQGPAVTRYELTPPEGVKVSKIESLENDIMLALAANSIRMEVPIPGKSAIGIEIPNDSIRAVYFSEILMSEKFNNFESKLAFGLGKDITGNVIVRDIAKMPHLLIAGATGSGKSVCVNTMLTSILYKATPDEVKLILIDPKVVELSVYNGIPHLLIPVVTDPHKAAGALNWAVREMMRRYDLFASTGTRKLEGYNEKVSKEERLPQILVVIDELADLMIAAKKEVENSIQRLTQLARAAGIHLIIATQRPSVDVITGVIKANVPSRIAFKVSSATDSRTILDTGGADKLLGKGDMLLKTVDMDKPLRIQGAFVSDDEVEKIVNYIKVDDSHYDMEVVKALERASDDEGGASSGGASSNGEDALINDVISFVVHSKRASISSIQRKFRIGYNRAANIMDELEERGIVGADNGGTKGRDVLMDKYQFSEWQERRNDF